MSTSYTICMLDEPKEPKKFTRRGIIVGAAGTAAVALGAKLEHAARISDRLYAEKRSRIINAPFRRSGEQSRAPNAQWHFIKQVKNLDCISTVPTRAKYLKAAPMKKLPLCFKRFPPSNMPTLRVQSSISLYPNSLPLHWRRQ